MVYKTIPVVKDGVVDNMKVVIIVQSSEGTAAFMVYRTVPLFAHCAPWWVVIPCENTELAKKGIVWPEFLNKESRKDGVGNVMGNNLNGVFSWCLGYYVEKFLPVQRVAAHEEIENEKG